MELKQWIETRRAMSHTFLSLGAGFAILTMVACGGGDAFETEAESVDESVQAIVTTPIEWSDTWVNGWTGAARGFNDYAHASEGEELFTLWLGDPGSNNQYSNRSDCSHYVNTTFKRSYGWTDGGLVNWLCDGNPSDCSRPKAKHYHDTIVAADHFTQITNIASVAKGDLIAMKYYDSSGNTGHVMWADGAPTVHCSACSPKEYKILVIDSSNSYHGTADTRYIGGACTTDAQCSAVPYARCSSPTSGKCTYSGIGRGTARLFTDSNGEVIGYSWSTASNSTRYLNTDSPLLRHIVIGRYDGSSGQ